MGVCVYTRGVGVVSYHTPSLVMVGPTGEGSKGTGAAGESPSPPPTDDTEFPFVLFGLFVLLVGW